jgi:hypothetical protein
VQLCTKALQQTGQQFKSFSQPLLTFAVQLRPAVVGCDTDIFRGRWSKASLQPADKFGIRAGEFIDLLAHLLEVIVIARVFASG